MALINSENNLPDTYELTCTELTQSIPELLRNNQRAGEFEEPQDLWNESTTPNVGYRNVARIIEETIKYSRNTRDYIQAHVFTCDASQGVPEAGLPMQDVLNDNLLASEQGELVPLYFEPLILLTCEDLEGFEYFITTMHTEIKDLIVFVKLLIKTRIQTYYSLFRSGEFQDISEENRQKLFDVYIGPLVSKRSRLEIREKRLNVIYGAYIKCRNALASSEFDTLFVDSARRILLLRDAVFYVLEDYEGSVLDTLDIIRDIYSF